MRLLTPQNCRIWTWANPESHEVTRPRDPLCVNKSRGNCAGLEWPLRSESFGDDLVRPEAVIGGDSQQPAFA